MAGLGVLFFGGGYLISKWRSGTKEEEAESRDLISSNDQIKQFYKDQNDDLKAINKALSDKVEMLTREVGEIKGQLNAETKVKEEYLAILRGRDPETKKFMELMVQSVKDQAESQKEIIRVLSEIHSYAKQEHEREVHIEAQITKS